MTSTINYVDIPNAFEIENDFELYESYKKLVYKSVYSKKLRINKVNTKRKFKKYELDFIIKPIESTKLPIIDKCKTNEYILICPKQIILKMNWKAYDLPDEIEYEDEYEWESNFEDYELVENIPGNVFGCDLECNQNKDFCDYTYETPSETDEVELIPKKNIIEQVLIITADFYDYYNTQVAKLIVKQCNKEELLNLVIEQYTFKYAYWANRSVITEWEHNNCLLKKEVAKALFLKTIKPSSILIGYGLISALTDLGIVHHNVLELCPDEMCKIKDKDTTPEYWRKLTRLHLADLSNVERGNAYWKKKATLKLLEYYLNRKYYPQKRKLLQVCNPLQYSKELIHLAHTRKYKKENRF